MPASPRLTVEPGVMDRYVTELGRIGALPTGGVTRRVYDASWVRATATLEEWMRRAGLETRHDSVGNLFGRLPGTDPHADVILTGSHVDTVIAGGRYDGALGILGALAALGELRAHGLTPRRTIEVVAICEEEGSRFKSSFLGSRAMLGLADPTEAEILTDEAGVSLGKAMRDAHLDPERIGVSARDDVGMFLELHVEQGPVLNESDASCGVVTTINGLTQTSFEVRGQADHAGAMPMDRRRDAMTAATRMIGVIDDIVRASGSPAVGTVGEIRCEPGSANTIPERVLFTLDLRHPVDRVRQELLTEIEQRCRSVAGRTRTDLLLRELWTESASVMDSRLQAVLGDAASDNGSTARDIASGAAHDSQLWARHVPTAMLFVPSEGGRSHNPHEFTSAEDCARGATVLLRALQRLAF